MIFIRVVDRVWVEPVDPVADLCPTENNFCTEQFNLVLLNNL